MPVNYKDHLDIGGNRIENLADPTADQHAATRAYVLNQIAGAGGYTDEAARDAIAAALVAGNNIDITVNDAGDTITIDVEALTSADLSDFNTAADARVTATVTGAFVSGLSGVDADTLGGDSKATILAAAATAALDTEEVQDIIGAAITAGNNIDVTYDDGAGTVTIAVEALTSADISDFAAAAVAAANAGVIDADTLGGSSKAQIVTDAVAAVVDSAPGTLDTLNELAAALGDDANFSTTVTNAIAAKTGKYAATVGGATSIAVTHNLGTRDVVVNVYDAASYDQVLCDVVMTSANVVTLGFASAPAASSLRAVVIG